MHHQTTLLATAIESLVLTGPAARVVEQHLVEAITLDMFIAHETERLLDLLGPTQFAHLRAALRQVAVQHAWRALDEDDAEETRPALAESLNSLGVSLRELGRHQQALDAVQEAMGLWRDLAAQEPARHTPGLAHSLNNLAITLCGLDRHDEELELRTEAVLQWGILARLDPDQHDDAYQRERNRLAGHFSEHDREPDAAWRAEEDLAHRPGLET